MSTRGLTIVYIITVYMGNSILMSSAREERMARKYLNPSPDPQQGAHLFNAATQGSQVYLIQCCQLISRPLKSKELESIAPAPLLPVFMCPRPRPSIIRSCLSVVLPPASEFRTILVLAFSSRPGLG